MDFRLEEAIYAWMEKEKMLNDADIISIGGAGKILSEDSDLAGAKELLAQIALSKHLHNIQTVYLLHHTDCGAYGGRTAFRDRDEEREKHRTDMAKEKKSIEMHVKDIKVIPVLADIAEDGAIEIARV